MRAAGYWLSERDEPGVQGCTRFASEVQFEGRTCFVFIQPGTDDGGSSETPEDLADELLKSFEVGDTCLCSLNYFDTFSWGL